MLDVEEAQERYRDIQFVQFVKLTLGGGLEAKLVLEASFLLFASQEANPQASHVSSNIYPLCASTCDSDHTSKQVSLVQTMIFKFDQY